MNLTRPILAYTRYCFVWAVVHESRLFFEYAPSDWAPHPTPSSRTLLRNIMFAPDPPLLQYTPHNIGNGNIV